MKHPLNELHWVDPATLHSNDYNPNRVFGPELDLLKTSIIEDGWTQPIVARRDGTIVDGFHRWTIATRDPEVRALADGKVPVVYLEARDRAHQMMSTVRHNRARGQHGILKMGAIVRELLALGCSEEELQGRLGMEDEEVERLADTRGSPEHAGVDSFGRGWIPDDSKR